MYPDRDFDPDRHLPPNEAELSGDLELGILLRAMASGDKFLFRVARQGIHSGLTDPAEIAYRQHVLADCIAQPGVVRDLYDVAVAAIAGEKKILGWLFRDSPETIVHRTRQLLQMYVDMFRRLRDIADTRAASFGSEGFTRFFVMIARELDDEYLTAGCLLLCNESFASTNEREGSEIARQIIRALTEAGIRIIVVTHLYDLAERLYAEHDPATLFLRAERQPDGRRTFRLPPGEPLPTSYGQDLYQSVFGTAARFDLDPAPVQA